MSDTVYVSGHQNPDTDSIISAIAYAHFLNAQQKYDAVPVRLGTISRETQFVLDRFELETPMLLKTVKQKVEDLDYDKVTLFAKELTLKTAWDLMKQSNLKSAPVLDDNNQLIGLLSTSNIIEGYMDEWDSSILAKSETPIENIVDTLDAKILHLNKRVKKFKGDIQVAAMMTEQAEARIKKGDIVMVGGDRVDTIRMLKDKGVSLIILTGGLEVSDEMKAEIEKDGITTIVTPHNTFEASQLIIQAVPIEFVMQKGNIQCFSTDDTVDYMKEIMTETRYRSYPVIDLNGHVVGSLSRYQLLSGLRKKVIQVDHNERAQSIPGIEEAEIVEIIDHHRVADIQTIGPVYFRCEPLGSTCTIVTKAFIENQIEIPKNLAGALLCAIISDTLLFKSPTCTPTDTKIAKYLASLAEVDMVELGKDMFKAGTSLKGKSVDQIFFQDYKRFTMADRKVGVAQVNTMDIEGFAEYKEEMVNFMNSQASAQGLDAVLLLLTDVINAASQLYVVGEKQDVAGRAFNVKIVDNEAFLPGIISRKKQVVPSLTEAFEQVK
ncbi:MAG: putative manganese-dependent inorganic diphosphatase [Erysipelotrichaceae bacterium]|nr:putative manganese-dependent inorganic diphosphatase [Erysipelotrichaceae bacterium]